MGRPKTLLERLSEHVQSFDCGALTVEPKDGQQCVFARFGGEPERIAAFKNSTADGQELRQNLYAAARKPVRAVIEGRLFTITARILDRVAGSFGEDAFEVSIDPAPPPDPSGAPSFTPKQGQYLAFIYHYTKIHRQAPAESDLERYFQVSPPAIHDMIKTLERNGLIRRTPRQARSIQLLVWPEYLPALK
jgi:repressor LexA